MGKNAGHNAASDLFGRPLESIDPGPYRTCLDLGPGQAATALGWDRTVPRRG